MVLPGDNFRLKHDSIKMKLYSLANEYLLERCLGALHLAFQTITFCQSYHFPGATKQGVELRGDALPAEYLRKARGTDRNFCNTAPDIQGPVETKLRSFPPLLKLVVGPFGECSGDMHELLNTLAESKTQYLSRSKGEPESEWKTASHLRGGRFLFVQ